MGGFTNEELDELNLGKNFKYPDISGIKTDSVIPDYGTDHPLVNLLISLFGLMGIIMSILYYFSRSDFKVVNFFKSLKNKIWTSGPNISHKTMIVPK